MTSIPSAATKQLQADDQIKERLYSQGTLQSSLSGVHFKCPYHKDNPLRRSLTGCDFGVDTRTCNSYVIHKDRVLTYQNKQYHCRHAAKSSRFWAIDGSKGRQCQRVSSGPNVGVIAPFLVDGNLCFAFNEKLSITFEAILFVHNECEKTKTAVNAGLL